MFPLDRRGFVSFKAVCSLDRSKSQEKWPLLSPECDLAVGPPGTIPMASTQTCSTPIWPKKLYSVSKASWVEMVFSMGSKKKQISRKKRKEQKKRRIHLDEIEEIEGFEPPKPSRVTSSIQLKPKDMEDHWMFQAVLQTSGFPPESFTTIFTDLVAKPMQPRDQLHGPL